MFFSTRFIFHLTETEYKGINNLMKNITKGQNGTGFPRDTVIKSMNDSLYAEGFSKSKKDES